MRKRLLPLTFLIGIIIFIVVLGIAGINNIILAFRNFSLKYLVMMIGASAAINLLSVYKWKLIMNENGHKIDFSMLFLYKNAAFSISYMTPFLKLIGEPMRALMLKRHNIPTAKAMSCVFLDKSLEILMNAVIVCITITVVVLAFPVPEPVKKVLIAVLTTIMILFVVLFLLTPAKGVAYALIDAIPIGLLKKIRKILFDVDYTLNYFLTHRKLCLAKLFAITALQWIFIFLEFKFAAMIINYNATAIELFLMILATGLSAIIPVPAGIGVLEASLFSAFTLLGANAYTGIALSFIIRLKDTMWALLGMIFLSHQGMGLFGSLISKRKR